MNVNMKVVWVYLLSIFSAVLVGCGGGDSGLGKVPSVGEVPSVRSGQVASLVVTPKNATVAVGLTVQMQADAVQNDGQVVSVTTNPGLTWASEHEDVATIDSEGRLIGRSPGTATITAELVDKDGSTVSDSVTVTVKPAIVQSLQVTPPSETVPAGLGKQFSATAVLSDGTTYDITRDTNTKWSSEDGAIATISALGLATGQRQGSVKIRASYETPDGLILRDEVTLTVTSAVIEGLQVTSKSKNSPVGVTTEFKAVALMSDGDAFDVTNDPATGWRTSDASIATITTGQPDNNGQAVGHAVGEVSVTASTTINGVTVDGEKMLNITAPIPLSMSVSPAMASIAKGIEQPFSANLKYSDGLTRSVTSDPAISWVSDTASVATIQRDGRATGEDVGTAILKASGTFDGVTLLASATLTVTQAEVVSLEVTPAEAEVPVGHKKAFFATVTMTDGSKEDVTGNANLSWTSDATGIATVIAKGQASGVTEGVANITASYPSPAGGAPMTGSATLTVVGAVLESIEVPASVELYALGTATITANGVYSDGSSRDITKDVGWTGHSPLMVSVGSGAEDGGVVTSISLPYFGIQLGETQTRAKLTNSLGEEIVSDDVVIKVVAPAEEVITWGVTKYGGDSSSVRYQLTDVVDISSANRAFAALKGDGTVVTWGNWPGGNSDEVQDQLVNVKSITGNNGAFAAIREDGSVVTWGTPTIGGNSSHVKDELINVRSVHSAWNYANHVTGRAFAALREDGGVVAWGTALYGGDASAVKDDLVNVRAIAASSAAFAAVKEDGTVVTWGDPAKGGDSSAVEDKLTNVKSVFSNGWGFAAVREDGSVVTWGRSISGGDSSSVQAQLTDVRSVVGTQNAFAALRGDGSVVSWGMSAFGGDSSAVHDQLTDVTAIFHTTAAFAALKSDGTVVTWGGDHPSADSSAVQDKLRDVVTISSNRSAFAALKADGSVVTWGSEPNGGDSSAVKDKLTNVQKVVGNGGTAFAALRKVD
jgi:hypothetical protein